MVCETTKPLPGSISVLRWSRWGMSAMPSQWAVGSGVSELRIHYGPGYRVYFVYVRAEVIALLCGGDKDSQRSDIERAKRMATDWRRRHG